MAYALTSTNNKNAPTAECPRCGRQLLLVREQPHEVRVSRLSGVPGGLLLDRAEASVSEGLDLLLQSAILAVFFEIKL